MLRVRDDDVLVGSSSIKDTFSRFKSVHDLIVSIPGLIHVPAILVSEIQEFPACIEYVQKETVEGRMKPELHGYSHIDYGKLSELEIKEHLEKSFEWFSRTFGFTPTKWYTPWGALQDHIKSAAKPFNVKLVGQCMKTNGRHGIIQLLRNGNRLTKFDEIGIHWWKGRDIENLNLLKRFIETGDLNGSLQSVSN